MKTVLIYGDSNTYGEGEFNRERLPKDKRWVNILSKELKGKADIIAEGFSGRTAGNVKTGKQAMANGQYYFNTIYGSHTPIDVVIIALGTNDCQPKYHHSAEDILVDLRWYSEEVREIAETEIHAPTPKIVYIVPPTFMPSDYFSGNEAARNDLAKLMQDSNLEVVNTGKVALSRDGVHFSEEGHQQMAKLVAKKLEEEL